MGTEETKSTTDTANNTAENNVTTTQNIAFGEEKIKADEEEEEISSREKKPANVSTTTSAPDPKIEEEEKNVIVVANNQQPPVPTSTREESDEIKIQTYSESTPLTKEDDNESLSMKAHKAEESVLDALDAVGAKVESFAKEKFVELDKSLNPNHMSAVQDSLKIEALGPKVEELARVFEDTTTMIRKVPYEEQVDLLIGYKKLIEEQIKVIDSRMDMAKRLK
jgi:hypothetical protein